MTVIVTTLLFLLSPLMSAAGAGDTVTVQAHQARDMTTYGPYDQWAVFPKAETPFREVTMTYTVGCASSGCSDWDYTTEVIALKPTGKVDSTQKSHPAFKTASGAPDSLALSRSPTQQVVYDTNQQMPDTVQRDTVKLVRYQIDGETLIPVDTVNRWPAAYFRYALDSNGLKVDSQFVRPDTIWQNRSLTYYQTSPVFKKVELASVITPYGGYMSRGQAGFDNSWKRRYRFDVTDFRKFLRDSIKLRVFYDGYSSGFSASVRFNFIKGEPSREVAGLQTIYQGSFGYKNPQDFENNQMPAKTLQVPAGTEQAKVRVIASGHGFDNNTNCAEFCKKHYKLSVNGDQAARQLMWRNDCGMNPTYPQGGTWLLNRANWCPGSRVTVYEHNVTDLIQPGSNKINIDVDPIRWSGEQRPSYHFAVQLITYSNTQYETDAALAEIQAPSTQDAHARINPAVMAPRVAVKNKGTNPINQLTFAYGTVGGPANTFTWEGTLKPMEQQEITFPRRIQGIRSGSNQFRVAITKANGQPEANTANNERLSEFSTPPVLPKTIVAWLTTNAQADQNTLSIVRANGDTVYHKADFAPNTAYRDTIALPDDPGLYKLELSDDAPGQSSPRDENGLYYPFFRQAGEGIFSLRKTGRIGALIKQFNNNFGSRIVYHFATGNGFSPNTKTPMPETEAELTVAPNPTEGQIRVESDRPIRAIRVINQVGQTVYRKKMPGSGVRTQQVSLARLEKGVYYIQVQYRNQVSRKKLVIQ